MTRKIIPNSKSAISNQQSAIRSGSAIILAIVLTTLLAILGVLFLLSSRVDSVATSAVGDNQDLKLAVDTVVSQISKNLANGVPGVVIDPCLPPPAYYDYPDPCTDFWLACLEPYQFGSNYFWRQTSDIYGVLGLASQNVIAEILPDYNNTFGNYTAADADGDGVSDSIWVQVSGKMSTKGKPIYAAVRIIDNGGMLNINTAYRFDPCDVITRIDGSSQTQINLLALANRPFNSLTPADIQARADYLNNYRCGTGPNDITSYANNVVWKYDQPVSPYTPFDISDELELRYRYLVNQTGIDARFEAFPLWEIGRQYDFRYPIDTSTRFDEWKITAPADGIFTDPNQYAYRHIATTYNLDRIINPNGQKMFNINRAASVPDINIYTVRDTLRAALDPYMFDANQIAVNLIDYLDSDSNVTYFVDPYTSPTHHYFGFDTPCIYISEIAQNFYRPADANIDPNIYRSYAIELFKPYWQDDDQNGWEISTVDDTGLTRFTPIVWTGSRRFHVLENINSAAKIPIEMNEPNEANIIETGATAQHATDINFGPGTTITLWRDVNGAGRMPVDWLNVPDACSGGWMDQNSSTAVSLSFERDIASIHRCIRKVLSPTMTDFPTIGFMNRYNSGSEMIQAHPANKPFTNVGEIGQLFRRDAYSTNEFSLESDVRLNIADPNVQNLFKYLTIIDPTTYTLDPNQTRIKGRININTAPWFVLAQLPWVSYHAPNYDLARSIENNRDIYGAFKSTGELMRVIDTNNVLNSMGYYAQTGYVFPALTPPDGGSDLFELRDAIFTRISNLVTVRSDVFTAYILVRIGPTGPQKRVIAILDRSGVTPTGGKVKIVAIQQVPDPR
jgi:hypothetical protein